MFNPPGTSAESKQLKAVQSKATALVIGVKKLNSEERRKKLGLMTLEQWERGDLIEVFKILHGLTRIDPGISGKLEMQGVVQDW